MGSSRAGSTPRTRRWRPCWFRPSGTGSGSRTGRMPVTPTRPTCCSACGATWDESRWHRHHAPPRGAAAATAHRRRPQPPPAEARRAPQQRSGPRRRVRGEAPVPAGRRPAAVGPPRLRARGPSLRARVRDDTGDGDRPASRRHAVHVGRETPEDRPREDGRLRPRLRRIGSWRRLHARPGRRGRRVVAAHARTGHLPALRERLADVDADDGIDAWPPAWSADAGPKPPPDVLFVVTDLMYENVADL